MMKTLLSDELVEVILSNVLGIGIYDILDMIDKNEIKFKQGDEIDEERSIFMGASKTMIMPVYKPNNRIIIEDKEIPVDCKVIAVTYESTRAYLLALNKQIQKYQRKVHIEVEEIKQYMKEGYTVMYDNDNGLSFNVIGNESKFTIDELSELKFYVIK